MGHEGVTCIFGGTNDYIIILVTIKLQPKFFSEMVKSLLKRKKKQ